jgi:hypothetical protein
MPAPVPVEQILRECLRHKRPSHQWAIMMYSPHHAIGQEAEPGQELRFSSNAGIVTAAFERQVNRLAAANGPLGAGRQLVAAACSLIGERHVVLLSSGEDTGEAPRNCDNLGAKARYHGITIHGLALAGCRVPWLASLCRETGGHLLHAATEEEVRSAIWRIFWGLQYQDEITYRLESTPSEKPLVRVEVISEMGMASDSLLLD